MDFLWELKRLQNRRLWATVCETDLQVEVQWRHLLVQRYVPFKPPSEQVRTRLK